MIFLNFKTERIKTPVLYILGPRRHTSSLSCDSLGRFYTVTGQMKMSRDIATPATPLSIFRNF